MNVARDFAYALLTLVAAPMIGWKAWRHEKYRGSWSARMGHLQIERDERPTLLLHAVSVGEVNATRHLVDELVNRYGNSLNLIISTTTDTGLARAKSLYGEQHQVVRFPLDFSWAVKRFLSAVRPDLVVMMELELWPNFSAIARRRQIPLMIINGRLSERSHRGYRRVRPLIRTMFASISAVGAQDEAIRDRFIDLGTPAERITVTGTMKWDTAELTDDVPGADQLAEAMGIDRNRPLIVCGSTGPGEEAMMIEQLSDLTLPWGDSGELVKSQLLIAPRKPERFNEAAAVMNDPIRRTTCQVGQQREHRESDLFLLDTLGELRQAYSLADLVVVGRSFCPLFGSDMMEPIALGKPTIIGPNTSDFAEQMEKLVAGQGIRQIADISELRESAKMLIGSQAGRSMAENGRAVIRSQQGATRRHLEMIASYFPSLASGSQ